MTLLRNIAIIAHVDHGKTTLVDKILHQTRQFDAHQQLGELILDNNELERERGITILAKNVSVRYKGVKINIIDTPGHADFGGEVERVLNMADGVLLLVDAFEGPMPQTRFVLQKALSMGKKPIVVINKVDKPNCRPEEVHDAVFELFFNLDATEEQLNFPTVYGSSKQGWMGPRWDVATADISYLLDTILEHIPPPTVAEGSLQMMISSLDYSNYTGRIAVGRVLRNGIRVNQPVSLVRRDGAVVKTRVKELYTFEGLGKVRTEQVDAGDICAVFGLDQFDIGDTIADFEQPEGLAPIQVDEPTISMLFTINNSPFFGKEGKYVTSRHLRERLERELEKNLAMRLEDTDSPDVMLVYGRGILHLSILIETMRREGYELQVGQPRVLVKTIDGVQCEPIELLTIDVPDAFSGKVIEQVSMRKGELKVMETRGDLIHIECTIPSRGLIGLRNILLTASAGEAIIAHRFLEYQPWKGTLPSRQNGVLVSKLTGSTTAYSIAYLQDRGRFFVDPGEAIYTGQILGEHIRPGDLVVNVVEGKKLTNMRASGSDGTTQIVPKIAFSLEEALEYIQEDEYVEVTPKSIRLRKILLDENDRKKAQRKLESAEA